MFCVSLYLYMFTTIIALSNVNFGKLNIKLRQRNYYVIDLLGVQWEYTISFNSGVI